jgi:probable F420-dependent oxidoreductase
MKFSTGLPNSREGRQNPMGSVDRDAIVRAAVAAEAAGFHALWPNEFFVSRPDVSAKYGVPPNLFEAIVTMSYTLAATERIRVMPSVLVLPLHDPIVLARQVATMDVFSGGRVRLGIGLGGSKEEYGRLRADNPNRSKLIAEYVAAMRVLWTEPSATYDGEYVRFTELETYPKPIQNPLPVLRAGHGDAAFAWIAAHGDGWIDSNHPADEIAANVQRLKGLAAESGRADFPFEIARQWYVSLGETEAEAQANFEASLPPPNQPTAPSGASPTAAEAATNQARTGPVRTLIGTPDYVRESLRPYVAAGVTEMCVIFYSPNVEAAERQMRLFAEQVIPDF